MMTMILTRLMTNSSTVKGKTSLRVVNSRIRTAHVSTEVISPVGREPEEVFRRTMFLIFKLENFPSVWEGLGEGLRAS